MIHFPRDILCIFWWWTIIAWNKRNSRKAYPLQRSPKIDFRVATIGKIDASLQSWNVIRWVAFCIYDRFVISSHYPAIHRLSHWKVNMNNFRWHYHPDVEFASAIERFLMTIFSLRLISTQQISEMNSDIVIMITFTKIGGKTVFRKLNWVSFPWQ